jgi:NAD(P)-dependent dehydrogenase (short-subunit alcohol dehydrogenase family)
MGRLKGRRTIVTGAGSGIGRASAALFAAEGVRGIAADKDQPSVGSACAASKADVIGLVHTAANALSAPGVRVNAIWRGLLKTAMTTPLFEGARGRGSEGRLGQLNPLRRQGGAREIAAMGRFLASDEASYVNGQAYAVDGGLSSTHPFRRRSR